MKITRATLKSFIKNNQVFIKVKSSFDGMTDCVQSVADEFRKVEGFNFDDKNTFGISGLWLVDCSNNLFQEWENDEYRGIEIYNCCGASIIATKK